MGERQTLLVGSIPADSAEDAMTMAMREVGPYLRSLPDGETGERAQWIKNMLEGLGSNPDLELLNGGGGGPTYRRPLRYVVRRGRAFTGESLDLGVYKAFVEHRGIFQELCRKNNRADLAFQVGLPSDFGFARLALGLRGGLRHRRAFTNAVVREIEQIHAEAGDEVLFQLELPVEMVLTARTPGPLRGIVASWVARGLRTLIDRTAHGARFGVHLCLGDSQHKTMTTPRDAAPLVHVANAIAKAWPQDHRLEYLHAPLAAGDIPPTLDPDFYRPLARLRLPGSTRLVAGFLHEGRTTAQARHILRLIEAHYGRTVDIAAFCGLGRRDHDTALAVMRQGRQLSTPPIGPVG